MGVKFHLCLLLITLGIVKCAQQEQTQAELPPCDWPVGFCVYYKDPCPQDTHDCGSSVVQLCSLRTNKCCCWNK